MGQEHSFALDTHLGKLARWLRMLGHDVTYDPQVTDTALLEEGRKRGRIIVTRDKELFQKAIKANLNAILLKNDKITKQLKEIAIRLKISLELNPTRCSICNGLLVKVSKQFLTQKVPKRSLKAYNEFWECQNCGKIFWPGIHWQNISKTLRKISKSVNTNK